MRINVTEIIIANEYFRKSIPLFQNSTQINHLYNKLQQELNGIIFHHENRNKRGLFNVVGSLYKFLFGTLDDNDRVEFEKNINNLSLNIVQINEINDIINIINNDMKIIQEHQNKKNIQDTLTYQLSQFIEYIEDIEMGMQLSRLGLFNPKLLTYDKLDSVNNRNILLIKTSTWINYQDNIILIISHIPIDFQSTNTIKIIPYPDHNGYQLDYISTTSYFEKDNKIYKRDNKPVIDECITKILQHSTPICNFERINNKEMIKYIEPNTIVTWNITNTTVKQNCQKNNVDLNIQGNKIISINQCKMQINDIILSDNYLQPEVDLTPLYPPL